MSNPVMPPTMTRANEKFRAVSKEDFDAFVDWLSKPLTRDVCSIYEPPMLSYNDFSEGKVWPESVVARVSLFEHYGKDDPDWAPNVYYVRNDLAALAQEQRK